MNLINKLLTIYRSYLSSFSPGLLLILLNVDMKRSKNEFEEVIVSRIFLFRGVKIMLDRATSG
jgi:hypothetical protein